MIVARLAELRQEAPCLDDDETARATAMTYAQARDFIAARSLLRRVLGHELETDPRTLAFSESATGKPRLVGDGDLEFNVSHGGELVLVALTRGRSIGVDVEPTTARRDLAAISEIALGPEARALLRRVRARDRGTAFARMWVRLEAICKATGDGLMFPVDSTIPDGFVVRDVVVPAGHVAAIAISQRQP